MKIAILTDGKYGDRAVNVIKKKFPETKLVILREQDPSMILDEVDLEPEVESSIQDADLLIVYVRHPDVVSEILSRQKPTILAINLGEGFFNQEKAYNDRIVMPTSMCNALPDTSIKEIDDYFQHFGTPIYDIKIRQEKDKILIESASLLVESPCGASNASIEFILGKEITVETLNSFAINVRQECREPVSYVLSRNDMSETSGALHFLNLIKALEEKVPSLFEPGTIMGDYAANRREEFKTKGYKFVF
ncbi:MAG: DUF166 family protein [Promethearchaeota archaeon]